MPLEPQSPPLVAFRAAPALSAHTFAEAVGALGRVQAASARGAAAEPPDAVLAAMALHGGCWASAPPPILDALERSYRALRLHTAWLALRRQRAAADPAHAGSGGSLPPRQLPGEPPWGGSPAAPPARLEAHDALAAYLAPDQSLYDLHETYDNAGKRIDHQDWDGALALLARAQRGYRRAGGLFELHSADCLLSLSFVGAHQGGLAEALRWAGAAQLGYERWGRLGGAAHAMLNRVGLLEQLGRDAQAARLARSAQGLAARARRPDVAADARCVWIALEARRDPRPALAAAIRRLARHYERAVAPDRGDAYGHCRRAVDLGMSVLVARQTVALILRRAAEVGVPDDLGPLLRAVQRHPEAVSVITGSSLLEVGARYWPALRAAVEHLLAWVERGAVDWGPRTDLAALYRRLLELATQLRWWAGDGPRSRDALRACRPSSFLAPEAARLSVDAARRLHAWAGPWARAWADDRDELQALGALCALAGAALAEHGHRRQAWQLLRTACACRPDVNAFLAARYRARGRALRATLQRLCASASDGSPSAGRHGERRVDHGEDPAPECG